MVDFSDYSNDDLLDELECLDLELTCYLGTEEQTHIERRMGKISKELDRRGYYDKNKASDDSLLLSQREDKYDEDDFTDCFGGEETFDEYGDLPF
jgi:hypothetical protein